HARGLRAGLRAGPGVVAHGAELVCRHIVANRGFGLAGRRNPDVRGAGAQPLAGRQPARVWATRTGDTMTPVSDAPSPAAVTRYLAIFLLLNAFVFNGILWGASPEPYKETVLQHTWDVLRGRGCDDSWGIMSVSLDYARTPQTTPLYSEIFFDRHLKFQYPPSSLFAIAGLLWLVGPERIRTQECMVFELPTLNDVLGWAFILMSALSAAALLEIGLRRRLPGPSSLPMIAGRVGIVIALTVTFYPVV